MAGNSIGQLFRLTTFGESHGEAIGGIIDGCPAGLLLDENFIQSELDRRKPGQSKIVTQRKESDTVRWLSGTFEGKTTGAPLGFVIGNDDQKPKDYEALKNIYRPSHADYTYDAKYGFRDYRGGGRSSARETAVRVAGGAVAKLLLKHVGVSISAYVSRVGNVELEKPYHELNLKLTETNSVRCPDSSIAEAMIKLIEETRKAGDSVGGVISCVVTGVPAGWGEPVFDKLHAEIGKAVLSINAVKGFEFGTGFAAAAMSGSQHNDAFVRLPDGAIGTATNHSGGIQGGISNGADIYFNVAFKPVATIMQRQKTVDVHATPVEMMGRGRHDPCVVPRAVPIVEAMTALVLADHYLRHRTTRI
jgi:chorismate synthase